MSKLFHSILFLAFSFNVFSQDIPKTKQRIIRDHYQQILELSLDGLDKDTLPNDRWPMYINGMEGLKQFLQENIRYPAQAFKEKIEGTVVFSYVITTQGTIKDIDISESPDVLLSNEIIRVMKLSGPWLPGMIDGSYKAMRMSKSYEFSQAVSPLPQDHHSFADSLKTGWYYITTSESGVERNLQGTNEVFFLNPIPIVTARNFTEMEIYKSVQGDYGLSIKLDKEGTKEWSIATEKTIGEKLAFVIDNVLVHTPKVNTQIDVGLIALNRKGYSKEELEKIMLNLESEKMK